MGIKVQDLVPPPNNPTVSSNSVAFFVVRLANFSNTILPVFLDHVAKGNQVEVEKTLEQYGALLLWQEGQAETYAKDLNGDPVIVRGTALQIALGAEDEDMVEVIVGFLDAVDPGEKYRQYQAQFPAEEEKAESLRQQEDLEALQTIVTAIGHASPRACAQVLDHEENISDNDDEAKTLLAALNVFRNDVKPKGVIKTGKQFNIQLLIQAFQFYDKNYETFGGFNSPKNNLCCCKIIGYLQRFVPACYAQAFAQGIYYIVEGGEGLRRSFNFVLVMALIFRLTPFLIFVGDIIALGRDWDRGAAVRALGAHAGRRWRPSRRFLENYVKQKQQQCKETCNNPATTPMPERTQ
ncbi:hypothetical protein AYM93_10565 (plasmid) [Coxiella burnetii]|nr:hypothetical protein COXBURSA331_0015 [Coxiella burnetii RSA 331]ARI66911.1 hypothetical protein B7L74_10975 [Coxiella burnetii]ARK28375.1 hypothetical protein BMW92_10605 [Coxiella burnetii]ATN75459.1 hypothetical protein AYM90_10590 [Coxiella burnetii]ATN77349.1 hypothetical protein AYM94_10480 [Coxiella burnetii]